MLALGYKCTQIWLTCLLYLNIFKKKNLIFIYLLQLLNGKLNIDLQSIVYCPNEIEALFQSEIIKNDTLKRQLKELEMQLDLANLKIDVSWK